MSSLYPDLTNLFDGATLDPNRLFQDVDIENKPHVDLFYNYYNSGNFSAIEQLFIDYPVLKNMIITAEALQYIYDMNISLQRFYTEDFRKFLIDTANNPIVIADDLTTDSNIMALSARQGKNLKTFIDDLYAVSYIATIFTNKWSETAPYIQEITVEELKSNDKPIIDIILSDNVKIAKSELSAWNNISRIDTDTNKIIVQCFNRTPRIDLNIEIRVMK